jgi:uncharacterized protein YjbJ (UPF0337 family)
MSGIQECMNLVDRTKQERIMNKDQVKGRIREAKGTVKEAAGKVTGKVTLEQKGKLEKTAGKFQAAYGDIKNDLKSDLKNDVRKDK